MSRVRFLIFPRKKVKIYAAANIWTGREYFGKSCRYNSRYSTGETPPIKAERPEPLDHLLEKQHHLNESSSVRLGGSQQLEILTSPNSKQTHNLGA